VLAWLTAALRPTGPYPILVLNGPSGSGKSVLARALRALIDPSAAPIHRLPARDHHLCELALHNWILIFDQVHRVPNKISDTLCALSSGDAIEITQPDLRDPLVFEVARPIILIAPHDETQRAFTPPRTLARRTLTVQLEQIARPRPEAAIWSAFQTLHAGALAILCDAVRTALSRIRDIDLGNVPRFPDCAAWTSAAAPALGLDEPAVLHAFADPASVWAGADPLREALHALLETTGSWSGDATDLLNQLRARVPFAALPATPKGLSQTLPNIAGIHITRSRNEKTRTLHITRTPDASEKKATADTPSALANP
jgi:putative DNA primase/helicase